MAMKISSFCYYVKQGLKSIGRNKMMSIASISTVMASLLILGIFYITIVNVNTFVQDVESTVEIKVYLKNEITDDQKAAIESEVKQSEGVTDISFESKEQALENFKKSLGDKGEVVEGIEAEKVMPTSYIIKLSGPQYVSGVSEKLSTLAGIDQIFDDRSTMDKLASIISFVKTFGISLMAVLLIVSIFLISNTIKLTVFARKREIGIMKQIGATNWFIRWPFVIEGMLLGLIGAILSSALLGYGYMIAANAVTENLIIVQLVDPYVILPYMVAVFLSIGFIIGSVGSVVSMRKFLNV